MGNFITQVSPQETISHTAAWIQAEFGWVPTWLDTKNTDIVVRGLSDIALVVVIIWVFESFIIRIYKWIRPPLKITLSLFQNNDLRYKHWRIAIYNRSHAVVENVRVRLIGIIPNPRYSIWSSNYPYMVKPLNLPLETCTIGPHLEEQFELICGWASSGGEVFTSGLDTKSSPENKMKIEVDEQWKLKYEITSKDNEPITLVLEAFVEDGNLSCRKATRHVER